MAKLIFLQNLEYPYMGMMYVSAMLKRHGHQCDVLMGESIEDFAPILQREMPQMIGFSVMTGMHQWARAMSQSVKRLFPDTLVVWGGPHPTFMPETVRQPGIDIICIGEADEAVVELANAVATGKSYEGIANLWIKKDQDVIVQNDVRPLMENLDQLPFPDRDLYWRYPRVGSSQTQIFMASRGCPFDCSFCFNHRFRVLYEGKGRLVRYRSVQNVMEEIRDVTGRMRVKNVYLNDDTLIVNRKWVETFTDAYAREIRIPFTCLIRADLTDEALIQCLAKGRCRSVFFGIETGNEQLRNGTLKKHVTDEQIYNTARWLRQYKIKYRTFNMLGLPGETLEDAFKTVEMNIRIKASFPWAAIFTPYPGTELGELSRRMGLLDPTFSVDDVKNTFHSTTNLKLPHRREIENLHNFFQTAVLFPWTFPLIKRLIRLPPNRLFVMWFIMIYGVVYTRGEYRGWWETLLFGIRNLKHLAPSLFRSLRLGRQPQKPSGA